MQARRPTVLVTGFGPFPGVPENASMALVARLASAARIALPGIRFEAEILPTEWRAGPERLAELLARLRPVLTLHFGVSSRADGFQIEARGRNLVACAPDAAAALPDGACIADGGPEFLSSTIPARYIVARLRRRGLPAEVSRDAGSYVCNALLYRVLAEARGNSRALRSGFVHIPDRLDGLGRPSAGAWGGACRRRGAAGPARLDINQAVAGGLEILAAALGRPPLPGGPG